MAAAKRGDKKRKPRATPTAEATASARKAAAAKPARRAGTAARRATTKPAGKAAARSAAPAKPAPPGSTGRAVVLRAPEASAERPYLHVGHGVSCARKTWGLVAILREPRRAPIKGLGAPVALDTIEAKVGERVVVLLHDADSLQWVVAATYPSPGPRADQGEATGEQWAAFNEEVDATLQRLHQRQPIAAVIRPCGALTKATDAGRLGSRLGDAAIAVYRPRRPA